MTPTCRAGAGTLTAAAVALLLCLAASIAVAAPAPTTASPPLNAVETLRAIFQQITSAIDAFAAGNAALVTIGKRTAVTLFGVLLVWGLIRSWILGKGFAQLLPEFIQPLVIFGLTFWAVDNLAPAVKGSVEALGGVFAQTLFIGSGPPSEVDVIDRMASAAFDVVSASSPNSATDWVGRFNAAIQEGIGFMFRLAAALVLLMCGAVAAGVMMMAKVQTALAVLFAPVMIPWAMWQPSAFLFNAWLTFLIGGAMQGVMAAAVACLSLNIIDAVVKVAKSIGGVEGTSFVTCCVILLMAVLIGFMFMKVPHLSAALVGSSALGMERWSAVGQSTGQGLQTVGKAANSVASGTYRFGKGIGQGWGNPGAGEGAQPGGAGSGKASGLSGFTGRMVGKAAGAATRASGARRSAEGGSGGSAIADTTFPDVPPPAPGAARGG